jgi:hypothetical protein
MSAFYIVKSVVKRPIICGYKLFIVLHVCMYVQYIQDLLRSRLGTTDHTLTRVVHVVTAV